MKILTLQEFVENKIPKKEDFKTALNQFESDCVLPFLGKEVIGAFAYGSVNRDDCSLSSDIDYFMIITNNNHQIRIREATKRAFEERNISIQTRVNNKKFAVEGFHGLDLSFLEHLGLSVEKYGHKGMNPLEVIASNDVLLKNALRASISNYLTKLNNGYNNYPTSEHEYVTFLKAILEKPFHAMRVGIQYEFGTVAPDGKEDFHDTKDALIKVYSRIDKEGLEHIKKLKILSGKYNHLLEQRQNGKIPPSELESRYDNMLTEIMWHYPVAYRFIERNAERMMK